MPTRIAPAEREDYIYRWSDSIRRAGDEWLSYTQASRLQLLEKQVAAAMRSGIEDVLDHVSSQSDQWDGNAHWLIGQPLEHLALEAHDVVTRLERHAELDPVIALMGLRNLAYVGWAQVDPLMSIHLVYPALRSSVGCDRLE